MNGATGRMGTRICALCEAADDVVVVAEMHRQAPAEVPCLRRDDVDLIIDFSIDTGTQRAVELCEQSHAAMLVGTTGLDAQTVIRIRGCAQHSPVMIAPNTARGVAVLNWLVAEAARLLGGDCDVDLIEAHHSAKRDQPSGTAKRLAETMRRSGIDLRPQQIHCIRAGGIIGRHTVQMTSQNEVLELTHNAISRDLFAAGALDAGRWLVKQPPGLYDIAQAWGLSTAAT